MSVFFLLRFGIPIVFGIVGVISVFHKKRQRNLLNQNVYDSTVPRCEENSENKKACLVCMKEFKYSTFETVTLPCNHKFHEECIQLIFSEGARKCPVCRTSAP